MAQQRDGVFTWIHADHLSSATRLTDAAGLEIRRLAYAAFGEEAENQGTGDDPKYTYTGKEQDSSGLYYSGARYYDPALSRFISADTVYDAGPQGLNRYAYALNNPMLYRDPTGHFITGPNDDMNPTAYGNVTGSQEHIADGSATVHVGSSYEDVWGRGMTLDELDAGGYTSFPADPKRLASPDPILSGIGPGGYVKGKLRDLEQQLYDEGGSVQQRIVDVQQGMMDELVSQGVSIIEMTDSTGGLMSGWQSRLIAGASERAMNFSYDTALGGLRPRKGGFYYKVGKYGMAVIIFLATIEAEGGSIKEYDIQPYGKFKNYPGDSFTGHELLQNAWLEAHEFGSRGGHWSRLNPAIALKEDPFHKSISAAQRRLGLNKAYLQDVSWRRNVLDNIRIMKEAGIPRNKIAELARATRKFAESLFQ